LGASPLASTLSHGSCRLRAARPAKKREADDRSAYQLKVFGGRTSHHNVRSVSDCSSTTPLTRLQMLSRRLAAARPLSSAVRSVAPRTTLTQLRFASENNANKENFVGEMAVEDIGMRAFRDPYGDWWDKQERRNFGEPVHEDNDTLGIFSTEPYTHFQPGHGAVLLGTFIASVFVLMGVVRQYYPDKASVPRTFPGGLDRELGGAGAVPARSDEKEPF
ncbi:unnamed protein product, partial [Aureobasidium pullulans]